MDSVTFNEYLEKRYYDQLNYYEKSSGKNQKKYKNFQWVLIILSALTPVLAAINGETINVQFAVVIVSAIVAILTTGMKTFQYQELWANYRATCEQLKPEIHYFNFNVGVYGMPGVDKESLFISRVEAILDKERQGWPPAKKIQEDRNLGQKENPGITPPDVSNPSTEE
jgi:hypothetical protein